MKKIGERNLSGPRNRDTSHAFTLPELLAIIAVIAFTALLMLPALFVNDHRHGVMMRCSSNLKQVGLAARVWAGDNNDHYPMTVLTNSAGRALYIDPTNVFRYFQVMSNELSNPIVLICPEDRKHHAATNFTTDFNGPHISYFVGLDADGQYPQMFLAGDSNLTNGQPRNGVLELTSARPAGWTKERHGGTGYVAASDGSVQQYTTSALQAASRGMTNRLLMPP